MPLLTNLIRSTRHKKVAPFISGDVLDLACGPAEILETHTDAITRYCGVEYVASLVEQLREKYPQHEFLQADLDEDTLPIEGDFDVILMLALVEHIYNQKHIFKEAKRLLRKGGRIVVTTPTPFGNDIVHRTGARLGLFSKVAADDHIHIYNKKRFQILAKDFGFEIERYERFQLGCNQLVILRLP